MSANFNTAGDGKEEWLTPRHIVDALGPFDLDPCYLPPGQRPWHTAEVMYWLESEERNGLTLPWSGRVWCNPPYGRKLGPFLERLAEHGNGIALVFARTETAAFHEFVWSRADAIAFPKGRIRFCYPDGRQGDSANAASCFIAYGENNVDRLKQYAKETGAAFLKIERARP